MSRKNASPALLALTASALALPGIASRAVAQEPAPVSETHTDAGGTRIDYRYSEYKEDSIKGSRTASGQSESRYDIDSHQFRVLHPIGDEYEISGELTYEKMSGASPWFVQPDPAGRPVQVMSGATITEKRTDVLLKGSKIFGDSRIGLSLGHSDEDDYKSLNFGIEGQADLEDKVSTISGGFGYSDDEVEPTQGTTPTGATDEKRDAWTAFAGYTRVLSEQDVVQTSLSYTDQSGFLTDPYKAVHISSIPTLVVSESRPDGRRMWAWTTRYRHAFPGMNAAAHVDYRYFDDDWKITSHTLDLAWHQKFGGNWRVTPGLRYYSQSQAFFYAPFFATPRSDGFASSDYRLSPYGALSWSLAAGGDFDGGWGFTVRYEKYNSDGNLALEDVDVESPGLVDFDVLSLSLRKTF